MICTTASLRFITAVTKYCLNNEKCAKSIYFNYMVTAYLHRE